MSFDDPRRRISSTDELLRLPSVQKAIAALSRPVVVGVIRAVQERARRGDITPEQVPSVVTTTLDSRRASSLTPVLNATGVLIHTNLGRSPLSPAALDAITRAAGYTDVELDLATGTRSRRGAQARAALLSHMPHAEDAHVVNNGAAALVLATTAFGAGQEVVISRGEFVEIGAGFRLSDLIESTGVRLREVGTTNRTRLDDYTSALSERTGALLKVHPSNFRVEGFTGGVSVEELSALAHEHDLPLIVDVGSGLFDPDPLLPNEPAINAALAAGADIVIASGDKLLGGPQAGIIAGRAPAVTRLARHPLARALRVDKLTLAALEATLNGSAAPVITFLHSSPDELRERTAELLAAVRDLVPDARVVPHEGRVGGGGGTGVPLPGWALALPERFAPALRTGEQPVLARTAHGACLVDLRCVEPKDDPAVIEQIRAAALDGAQDRRADPHPAEHKEEA